MTARELGYLAVLKTAGVDPATKEKVRRDIKKTYEKKKSEPYSRKYPWEALADMIRNMGNKE